MQIVHDSASQAPSDIESKMKQFSVALVLAVLFAAGCQNRMEKAMLNPYYSRTDTTVLGVQDSVWIRLLPADVYAIARTGATEEAFTGKYWDYDGIGTYYCAVCGNALFRSDSKFSSSCGWPSFFAPVRQNSALYRPDTSYGMNRTEVLCGRCGSHLGHLFNDGPPPTGKRYCMNSIVLDFEPDPAEAKDVQ
jgi:peptide-methionine (R)-S-oxide reductase